MSVQQTAGHELQTRCLANGRMAWFCECGEWHPRAADAPFQRADARVVIAYIKGKHEEHARTAIAKAKGEQQ